MSKEEEGNKQEELAGPADSEQTDTGSVDPTASNTAANSGLEKTLEELNLRDERNVIYRYSVSGLFPKTDAWKKIPAFVKRAENRTRNASCFAAWIVLSTIKLLGIGVKPLIRKAMICASLSF